MGFEVRTKSGDLEEARKLAAEITKRYGERLVVGPSHPVRIKKSYQLDGNFQSKNMLGSYELAFKSLQKDVRKMDSKAKVIEWRDEEIKRTKGDGSYPYSARVTITAVSESVLEFFDGKIFSLALFYGMQKPKVL